MTPWPGQRPRIAVMVAVAVCAGASLHAGQAAQDSGRATVGLATGYVDGRTTYSALKPTRGSSWTPLFPSIPGADTTREGLPLAALDVAHVMQGQDAVVTVSLIYGRPHQHRIGVATVTVTPDTPARVDQLTLFGVEPITFSIVPIPSMIAAAPRVTTVSPSLEASIEMAPGDQATFLVVVVNRSSQAVRGFRVEGERGGRRAISGYRKARRHTMLIAPGEGFIFEVPATLIRSLSGAATAMPLDRLAITSVTWSDGTVEGETEPAAGERVIAAGTGHQLSRILVLLREAWEPSRPHTPAEVRGRIAALPIDVSNTDAIAARASLPDPAVLPLERVQSAMRLGMQQAKEAALADLDASLAKPSADIASFRHWLTAGTMECEDWLTRIRAFARD